MKDWMLIVITLTTCAIAFLLVFLETAVPHLMGSLVKERDSEKLYGKDVSSYWLLAKAMTLYHAVSKFQHTVSRNKSGIFCMGLLQSLISKLFLEDLYLCLPWCAPDCGNSVSIPNKES